MVKLDEARSSDLISKNRKESPKRYERRLNYQLSAFRGVDLDQLFNHDMLVYETPMEGKSGKYVITIACPGALTALKKRCESLDNINQVNYTTVLDSLRDAYRDHDIKVRCTCPDFKYRFMYWANRGDYLYGPMDAGTDKHPDETNPGNSLGATCKHLNVILDGQRWLQKAASSVIALIRTYPDKAKLYLFDEEDITEEPTETTEVEETPEETTPDVEETPDEINDINNEESSEEESEEQENG